MSALTFTLRAQPPERLDLSPLVPRSLAGMAKRDMEKIRLGISKHALTVGDLFSVAGNDADQLVFEGGSDRFDCVGSGLDEGSIRVVGNVGAQAGRKMTGGALTIEGDAGPHAGSAMRGGRLEIGGDAGDRLGGPLTGEMAGMAGGVLVVRGRAGDCAGDRMRRGLIAVLKGSGDYAGCRMIAGTLAIAGEVGKLPGYLMRRGSILLDRSPRRLSPSFVKSGSPDLVFAALVDRHLIADGISRKPLLGGVVGRYGGDNAVLGKGEIIFSVAERDR
ncbi:formylmethanofuran dehydrogenase subunit C [Aquamicrobium sp. LC103]|uniref:formylmethanofuran dehydrogenase subunit C n=1 Tax=Aquamicrobium sp. LC103 TaxID=1120658 RepID=UPI00063E9D5C|nr:formylmethanofuran dehydrogenase subunit C [Aquamicrobium sp. LC103]TKT69346.1 formylmethanofuran dehydrogenase subunit C [Aquamicrobium sp. LC103]